MRHVSRGFSFVFSVSTLVTLCLLTFACTKSSSEKLVITGSSTIAPMLADAARAFEVANKGVRIDVQTGGSSRGIADARGGRADIGMVSRAPKSSEGDLVAHPIARDGVSIIVHKNNDLKNIDDDTVRKIYSGKMRRWQDVEGSGLQGPITVVNKAEGRSTLEIFLKFFKMKNSEIKASVVIGDNEHGIKTVAGDIQAIGYVAIGTAETNIAAGIPIRLVSINGITASTANVKNKTFPLSRQLTLVTKGPPTGLTKRFIDHLQSDALDAHLKAHAFVSLR